jgi:hypothetical protein
VFVFTRFTTYLVLGTKWKEKAKRSLFQHVLRRPAISVFSGSCDDLFYLSEGGIDNSGQDFAAGSTTFLAQEGVTYYILLQPPDGGDVGLTIKENRRH